MRAALGHSRRNCHVRSLVRYPQHRTLPRRTETVSLSRSCARRSCCVLALDCDATFRKIGLDLRARRVHLRPCARKDLPANNLKELIDWAKANPGKASVGVYLVSTRLLMAVLEKEFGAQFTLVPYRGAGPAMQDLLAGQIDLIIDTPIYLPMVRAGSIKALQSEARRGGRRYPRSRRTASWVWRQLSHLRVGSAFSHPGTRPGRSSASLMPRP
jgi:hypothetical protein